MTNREFLTAVSTNTVTDEVVAYAAAEISKLDTAKEKAATKNAEKRATRDAERAPIIEAILAALTVEPKTATQILAETNLDISRQLVSTLLRPYIADGSVVKSDVKVDKKSQVGYARA